MPSDAALLLETRAQFADSDLQAPPTDLIGPAVSIAGVASFGTASGSARPARSTRCTRSSTTSRINAGAHALRAGVDFLYNDDDITYPRSVRGSYTFSSMANFLSGTYNNAGFAQTFGNTDRDADESESRHLRAGRMEGHRLGHAQRRASLRPAIPRDHHHRYEQPVAAGRRGLDAVGDRGARSCAAVRACSTIACRCARWPTR